MRYTVIIAASVAEAVAQESVAIQNKFFDLLELFGSSPEIGREYLSENGDDEPPIPCRYFHIPDTWKTIYYHIDHGNSLIKVIGLIDQRRNPAYRFHEIKRSGWE